MPAGPTSYRGRFAPTPSGPLHLGSLLTALASWLQARSKGGQWLIRLDDLDALRCPAGTGDVILGQLEAHGLEWDEEPVRQSRRIDAYRATLEELQRRGLLYGCDCTRKTLKARSLPGPDDDVYDGHCRHLALPFVNHALRLKVGDGKVCIDDAGLGTVWRNLPREVGDFVVARNDGVPGYQLASVVDDRDMRIGEIVRGTDLLGSSLRQRHLFELLGLTAPAFRHLPVVTGTDGRKLSKQNHAQPLDDAQAPANLQRCLAWLGQAPPAELAGAPPAVLLQWARSHWNEAAIPRTSALALEPDV